MLKKVNDFGFSVKSGRMGLYWGGGLPQNTQITTEKL